MGHLWRRTYPAISIYTDPDLRPIHTTFEHPSVGPLSNLWKPANDSEPLDSYTQSSLRKRAAYLYICSISARPPRHLKLIFVTD